MNVRVLYDRDVLLITENYRFLTNTKQLQRHYRDIRRSRHTTENADGLKSDNDDVVIGRRELTSGEELRRRRF